MGLRQYQINGIDRLSSKFAKGLTRLIFQLATGGGKTYMFAGLIARYLQAQRKRVVILVHREELLQQAYSTLYKGFGITAAPVTADTTYLPNVMVYVAMVETANNRLKKNPNYFGRIGLLIVDEAHIGNHKKVYEYFPESLIIGFTATPIASSRKDPLKNHFQDIVCGIDIPELINMWRQDRTLGLVQNKTYHIANIDRRKLKIKNGEFDEVEMSRQFSNVKHVQNCIKAYKDFGQQKKAIIFNCNIEHSKKVRDAFVAFGYPCKHIDGETDPKERKAILLWFKMTPNAILCNVGIATTGYDEPSIVNVITNFSTLSLPKWLQTTGRGARPFEGKDWFNIIDLGGNAFFHGDWSDPRDWSDMFYNPEKPRDEGTAPVKTCVGCYVMIHASQKICPYCGAVNIKPVVYDDGAIVMEQLSGQRPCKINVPLLVEEFSKKVKADGTPYHWMATIHEIKRQVMVHAKYIWKIKRMDDRTAKQILAVFQGFVKEWCIIKEKKFNMWMESQTKEWLYAEFKSVYKWEPTKVLANRY